MNPPARLFTIVSAALFAAGCTTPQSVLDLGNQGARLTNSYGQQLENFRKTENTAESYKLMAIGQKQVFLSVTWKHCELGKTQVADVGGSSDWSVRVLDSAHRKMCADVALYQVLRAYRYSHWCPESQNVRANKTVCPGARISVPAQAATVTCSRFLCTVSVFNLLLLMPNAYWR